MNLINQKTLYIYKENPKGHWTVLFKHPYGDYFKQKINYKGIPVMYFTGFGPEFNEMFKEYKKIFRKPNSKTIIRIQWTILNEVYIVESAKMLLEKPPGNEVWKRAVKIFWDLVWEDSGIKSFPEYARFRDLTVPQIYSLLLLERNQIKLN